MRRAYEVVSHCDCGSSCYKCLRNYYNQKIHDELDRNKAAGFLLEWLGEMKSEEQVTEIAERPEKGSDADAPELLLPEEFGTNLRDSDWKSIWRSIRSLAEEESEKKAIRIMLERADLFTGKEKPFFDCTFTADEEFACALLWPRSKVMLFTAEDQDGAAPARAAGWTCLTIDDPGLSPEALAEFLKEE